MPKLSLSQIDVKGKRALVRVDFNVPLEERDGRQAVTDDTRIRESLPTINYLREHGAKVVLMSHLGRPKGKPVGKYSLRSVATRLQEMIGQPVLFSPDCIGKEAEDVGARMREGEVALLENVRFHPEEEKNDPSFAQALARLGEIMSTTPSAVRIARTPPRKVWRAFANCRGRFPDAKGAALSGPGIGKTGVPVRGCARRRQSLGQDHCD